MLEAIPLVIGMAHDYSLETRIRCAIQAHTEAGETPRTLVMNKGTWLQLVSEFEGTTFDTDYYWLPAAGSGSSISFFLGIPILLKDFVADMEVLVGV